MRRTFSDISNSHEGGAVTSQQNYDVWGKARGATGGTSPTTMNYTGQKRDDTGLLFYNARYYDPAIGRFLSADTIAIGKDSQSRNRYTYVGNNPINATDPTGHCPKEDAGTIYCDFENQVQGVSGDDGYHIEGIEKWTVGQLNDLLKWIHLGKGVSFVGNLWTANELDVVRQAFDRIYNAIGNLLFGSSYNGTSGFQALFIKSLMAHALGLAPNGRNNDPGNPLVLINGPTPYNRPGETYPRGFDSYNKNAPAFIYLDFGGRTPTENDEYWIDTTIHEVGHLVSFLATDPKAKTSYDPKNPYPYQPTWTSAITRSVPGETPERNCDGAVSSYACTGSPAENFSDTFVSWVLGKAPLPAYYTNPYPNAYGGAANPERYDAIEEVACRDTCKNRT